MGGVFGCLLARGGVYNDSTTGFTSNIAKICPELAEATSCSPGDLWYKIFLLEMISTWVLVSVFISVKRINGADDDIMNAATIAITLFGLIRM